MFATAKNKQKCKETLGIREKSVGACNPGAHNRNFRTANANQFTPNTLGRPAFIRNKRGGLSPLALMKRKSPSHMTTPSILVLGVGAFAHSTGQILKDAGARLSTYLIRNYGHFPPSTLGPTFNREQFPSPCQVIKEHRVDLVVPMSIDWAQAPWAEELLRMGVPLFSPTGEAMRIERERDFARELCQKYRIPFPQAHVARNRLEAEDLLKQHPKPFVIKNPLCSPTSPIHTILCESTEDTRSWLKQIDYAEGVFLQEYLGPCEAGHIALVSAGEIHSVVTNQEYSAPSRAIWGWSPALHSGDWWRKIPMTNTGLPASCYIRFGRGFVKLGITAQSRLPRSSATASGM